MSFVLVLAILSSRTLNAGASSATVPGYHTRAQCEAAGNYAIKQFYAADYACVPVPAP